MWKTCVNADGKIQMKKNGDKEEFSPPNLCIVFVFN